MLDLAAGLGLGPQREHRVACADIAEALLNSTFDHRGKKGAIQFATKNNISAKTMVCYSALTGGEPVLFTNYRKVYDMGRSRRRPTS